MRDLRPREAVPSLESRLCFGRTRRASTEGQSAERQQRGGAASLKGGGEGGACMRACVPRDPRLRSQKAAAMELDQRQDSGTHVDQTRTRSAAEGVTRVARRGVARGPARPRANDDDEAWRRCVERGRDLGARDRALGRNRGLTWETLRGRARASQRGVFDRPWLGRLGRGRARPARATTCQHLSALGFVRTGSSRAVTVTGPGI